MDLYFTTLHIGSQGADLLFTIRPYNNGSCLVPRQTDTLVLRCLGLRLLKISPYIRMSGMSDDSNPVDLNGLHCVTPASYRVLSGRNFKMG